MFGRWLLASAVALTVGVVATPGVTQQDEGPVLRPKKPPAKRADATLLVMCDLTCDWKLDGKLQGRIAAGDSIATPVSLGSHLVDASTQDGLDSVRLELELTKVGKSTIHLELQPVRDARLKAEQATRDEEAARQQAARDAERQRQQAAREEQERKARIALKHKSTTMPPLTPNVGDKIPGTQWSFQRFFMFGDECCLSGAGGIQEFGSNATYVNWWIEFAATKDSAASVEASCQYFDLAGKAVSDEMKVPMSLQANHKGAYNFHYGWGAVNGYWLPPGTYQIRCEIGGSPFLRASFDVGSDPLFPFVIHRGQNVGLIILSDGLSEMRSEKGVLHVSKNGVDFRTQQGKSKFQATCSELTATAGKENWLVSIGPVLKITHAGKTENLVAGSKEKALEVQHAIEAACGK
jgi:hypothetical protein